MPVVLHKQLELQSTDNCSYDTINKHALYIY